MEVKVSGRPTKAVSWVFIGIFALFLVFGVVFFASVWEDIDSDVFVPVLGFWVLWIGVVLFMIICHALNLKKRKGMEIGEFRLSPDDSSQTVQGKRDPMQKLPELHKLRDEGLISKGEFEAKRKEIMEQKW